MAGVDLATSLRSKRDGGRRLLIAYVMAGMVPDWVEVCHAVAEAGADAIEIGIPFSDPMMDGEVIQAAALVALASGITPDEVIAAVGKAGFEIPLAMMTYYNLVYRCGHERMAAQLAEAGITGAIVPDLSLEEIDPWAQAADAAGVATVLLVAPTTPPARIVALTERSRGFVYGVARMGVTGERSELEGVSLEIGSRIRAVCDLPVCVGVGISNPQQAVAVCQGADGVIVGSALVRRLLDGGGPEAASSFISSLRAGLDDG